MVGCYERKLSSMDNNHIWDLVDLPKGWQPIGFKWIYKIKRNLDDKAKGYKARLIVKGFAQKKDINFKETYSPISSKDTFSIVMALVAHLIWSSIAWM